MRTDNPFREGALHAGRAVIAHTFGDKYASWGFDLKLTGMPEAPPLLPVEHRYVRQAARRASVLSP